MAKLTRTKLKGIIKECLIEILAEGLASDSANQISESRRPARAQSKSFKSKRPFIPKNTALDAIKYDKGFEQAVTQRVSAVTSDPVMSSIFADTAKTTLQEQIHSEPSGRGSMTDMSEAFEAPANDMSNMEIFSDASKNWATLAFGGAPEKSS